MTGRHPIREDATILPECLSLREHLKEIDCRAGTSPHYRVLLGKHSFRCRSGLA